MPQIQQFHVHVLTTDDNKEDSRFELDVFAGNTNIYHLAAGESENWDDLDERDFDGGGNFAVQEDTPVSVVAALQDGPFGRNNDWNCQITVVVIADDGRKLMWDRTCHFSTRSSRRRHSISFGTRTLRIHGQR